MANTPADGAGPRFGQLGLILLCLVGLVLTAFVIPSPAPGPDGEQGGAGGPSTDEGVGLVDLVRWLLSEEVESEDDQASEGCAIAITPEPTPGRAVTVTVTQDGDPVAGAIVRFEGEPIGETAADGKVSGRVPYVEDFDVSATLPPGEPCHTETDGVAAVAGPAAATSGHPADPASADGGRNVSRTVPVDGEVRLAVLGTPDPGSSIVVRAKVADVPMRSATVSMNGRRVGSTDADGRRTLTVPSDGTERLRIRVRRGAFAGETTVVVRLLAARVVPVGALAVPGERARVQATLGTGPAQGTVVTQDGRRLGRTDRTGTLAVRLPADPRATFTVRGEGQTATAGVWIPYLGTVVVLALPVAVVAGAVAYVGGARRTIGRRLARLSRRLAAALVALAVWIANGVVLTGVWLGSLVRRVRKLSAFPSVIAGQAVGGWRRIRQIAGDTTAWLGGIPARVGARLASGRPHDGRPAQVPPAGTVTAGGEAFDLCAAWRTVARQVAPEDWRTSTSGDIVAAAVARGVSPEPVERLATAFEVVEYGGLSLTDDRRERARAAHAAVRRDLRRDPPASSTEPDRGGAG